MNLHPVASTLLRLMLAGLLLSAQAAWAQDGPRIAVTDLSYEDKVRKNSSHYEYREKQTRNASSRERQNDSDHSSSASASERSSSNSERSVIASSNTETIIERGELRKFTADIKGELIKAGYRLVQGKPWTQKETDALYDIIGRIKQGYYPGADYVLFGSVTAFELRREDNPIQGSNAVSHALSGELVVEFSLIDTKTYEVKAGFSATGEGSDVKMTSTPGTNITLNRSKVMQAVSRSLGEAAATEVQGQFPAGATKRAHKSEHTSETVVEKTIIYKE